MGHECFFSNMLTFHLNGLASNYFQNYNNWSFEMGQQILFSQMQLNFLVDTFLAMIFEHAYYPLEKSLWAKFIHVFKKFFI